MKKRVMLIDNCEALCGRQTGVTAVDLGFVAVPPPPSGGYKKNRVLKASNI